MPAIVPPTLEAAPPPVMLAEIAVQLASAVPLSGVEPAAGEALAGGDGILRVAVTAIYVSLLLTLCAFGGHRFLMVRLFLRHRRDRVRPARRFADDGLPAVTVQLPIYNEAAVAARVIDAAAALDYPRLQVQVLDDSNDGSERVGAERVAYWKSRGVDIEYLHREVRTGFKAGALAAGLDGATGELVAIFDADFVPPAGFLRRCVHPFSDPGIGMVQARWGHLNRDESPLTAAQAILLDGHFVVEHTARNRSGVFMHFNGTAGVWRRTCIDDAGGWSHDTLTEDVDLSYRAQLKGWRFRFLPRLVCPAELPREMNAFKTQQHRWTKGSVQTAIKLLPTILRSGQPLPVKAEAAAHLLSPITYLAAVGFTALCYPAVVMNLRYTPDGGFLGLAIGVGLLCLGTVSAATFYVVSQAAIGRSAWRTALRVPFLMALAVGLAVSNAAAVIEALIGHRSGFVRTPKSGGAAGAARVRVSPAKALVIALELGMGLLMLEAARRGISSGVTAVSTPFLLLFAGGYLYVGGASLWGLRPRTAGRNAENAARSAADPGEQTGTLPAAARPRGAVPS